MSYRRAKFIGGTHDGEIHEVPTFAPNWSLGKRISMEEHEALKIDEHVSWRYPEEVYIKVKYTDGTIEYRYSHTVNFKPEEDHRHQGYYQSQHGGITGTDVEEITDTCDPDHFTNDGSYQ